jgi:CRISPR-associated exonuclease Cas4
MHDFVVRVLRSEKNNQISLLESELPFQLKMKDFIISGRIDDLILIKADNKKVLIEVKSVGDIDRVDEEKFNHRMQLQLYMMALKIYDGVILYVDKKNLKSKVFTIPYSEEESLRALERFHILHDSLTTETVPPPEAKLENTINWMCNYCEYRGRCDKE